MWTIGVPLGRLKRAVEVVCSVHLPPPGCKSKATWHSTIRQSLVWTFGQTSRDSEYVNCLHRRGGHPFKGTNFQGDLPGVPGPFERDDALWLHVF